MRAFSDLDDLWAAWEASQDRRDRDGLVMACQPLIGATVARLNAGAPRWVDRDDQTSSGQIGLLEAIDAYRPELGVQFVYFAMLKIRGAVLDGLRKTDWVPKRVRQTSRELVAAEEMLMHRFHRLPTDAEVAGVMHLTVAEVEQLRVQALQASLAPAHLKATLMVVEMQDGGFEADVLEIADPAAGADSTLDVAVIRDLVARALCQVSNPVHVQVLKLYYVDKLTMAEAGRILGVSAAKFSNLRDEAVTAVQDAIAL